MSLLRNIGLFVCRMYGDDVSHLNLSPVEKWSLKAARLTSPDEIIGAAIIKSIAENFDDWKSSGEVVTFPDIRWVVTEADCNTRGRWNFYGGVLLTNTKKKIVFKYGYKKSARDGDDCSPWFGIKEIRVNETLIDQRIGSEIVRRWTQLKEAREKAETVAARAKAEMERNEAAWNLAESLLGMKRNEFGALVPVVKAEEV